MSGGRRSAGAGSRRGAPVDPPVDLDGASPTDGPRLLGEWACLGLLAVAPAHGFALASRLGPTGDVGRVWSMSRPLTYRSVDQLTERGLVEQVGVEPGRAGGQRVVLGVTRSGRSVLEAWLAEPVPHLRDLRSELLLKLLLLDLLGRDRSALLRRQREVVERARVLLEREAGRDVVGLWRSESAAAAVRFLDRLESTARGSRSK